MKELDLIYVINNLRDNNNEVLYSFKKLNTDQDFFSAAYLQC